MLRQIIYFILGLLLLIIVISWIILQTERPVPPENITWGVTFSQKYARDNLNLNWQKTYLAILDELKPERVRLIAYWDEVESRPTIFNFDDLDFQINEAAKRNVKIVLAVGRKVPRWPECFIPQWAKEMNFKEHKTALLNYLEKIITRYKDDQNIIYWQVENEPLFKSFGECPVPSKELLKEEIEFVQSIDGRSIMTTDSGELSFWFKIRNAGQNIFGTTMYRKVYNPTFGYFTHFFLPAQSYRVKAAILKSLNPKIGKVIVSELQLEPWGPEDTGNLSIEEQYKSMDINQFRKNIKYAKKAGLDEVYMWGVEWWHWMKEQHNIPDFWEEAKLILQ
jgi:hypothetical protein